MKIFYPRFSVYLAIILMVLYSGAFFCVCYAAILLIIKLIIIILLGMHANSTIKKHLTLSAQKSIIALSFSQPHWHLGLHSGEDYYAVVKPTSIVSRYIIVLNFMTMPSHQHFTLLLMPDSLPGTQWRQLRRLIFS